MNLKLSRKRKDAFTDEELIEALKSVSEKMNYTKFTRHEFDKLSDSCKGSVVLSRFKSWENALEATGLQLKEKPKIKQQFIGDDELLCELERIWKKLGQRPSKAEWEAMKPKYSYSTYKARFGGWVKACEALILEKYTVSDNIESQSESSQVSADIRYVKVAKEETRIIPLKLRLKVFQRDNFSCKICGKSPANVLGTVLHIDHIEAFSKGGKTTEDNLQTLCSECNWGKGNKPV